ncbi:MAG: endonuclease, partial [Catalinimonas sp.]
DVNSARGSLRFGEIADPTTDRWYVSVDNSLTSQTNIPSSNIDTYSELDNGQAFEPREDHKGNVARAAFYFYTMYPTQAGSITGVGTLNTLYEWHMEDPVDDRERGRNDRVGEQQGNWNPYISDPALVARAWGFEPAEPEVPTFRFAATGRTVTEGDADVVYNVTVRLLPAPTTAATVRVELDGVATTADAGDYQFSATTLQFAAGDTEQQVAVTVVGDDTEESTEVVALKLAEPSDTLLLGTPAAWALTIRDDDGTPAVTNTIAFQGFENSAEDTWTISSKQGASIGEAARTGQTGRQVHNGEVDRFADVDVSLYDSVRVVVSTAAVGVENADAMRFQVVLNGQTPTLDHVVLQEGDPSDENYNVAWTYAAAGRVNTTTDAPVLYLGDGNQGAAEVTIHVPDGTRTVGLIVNGDSNRDTESFYYDDVRLEGNLLVSAADRLETLVRVGPNPAADRLSIESTAPLRDVRVYDLLGRPVRVAEVKHRMGVRLKVADLPAGLYVVRWNDGVRTYARRWVKQ